MRNLQIATGILCFCLNTVCIQTAQGQTEYERISVQNRITANFRSAREHYENGDYEKALESIERVEELFDREDEGTTDLKIKILLKLKRYAEAEKELNKMEGQRPSRLDRFREDMADYRKQIDAALSKRNAPKDPDLEEEIVVDMDVEITEETEIELIDFGEETPVENLEPIIKSGTVTSDFDFLDENGKTVYDSRTAPFLRTFNTVPGKEITTIRRVDNGTGWGAVVSIEVEQKDGKPKTGLTVKEAEDGTLSLAYYREGKVVERFENVEAHPINSFLTEEGEQTYDESKAAGYLHVDFFTPVLSGDDVDKDLRDLALYTVIAIKDEDLNLVQYLLIKGKELTLEEFSK